MRLVDADALKGLMIGTIERIKANPKMDTQEIHILAAFHAVGEMVDDFPTVDAVPVVRCGECKHFGTPKCTSDDMDWFCADGERRE